MNLGVSGAPLKGFPEVSENVRSLKSNLALDAPDEIIDIEENEED